MKNKIGFNFREFVKFVVFAANDNKNSGEKREWNQYKYHIHPNYNSDESFDFAIIEIKEPFVPKPSVDNRLELNTICLPYIESVLDNRIEEATMFGWGKKDCCSRPTPIMRKAIHHVYLYHRNRYFVSELDLCEDISDSTHTCRVIILVMFLIIF